MSIVRVGNCQLSNLTFIIKKPPNFWLGGFFLLKSLEVMCFVQKI